MTMALDSPMEALAINYLTHGVLTAVNNLWAWIAFLTASISFWKIKSSVHQPRTSPVAAQPDQLELPSTTSRTLSFTSSKRYTSFSTLENRRSGKFSVYYGEDDNTKDDNVDSSEEDVNFDSIRRNPQEDERTMGSITRRNLQQFGWEAVLKMQTAEMEWYRYQDLTVLDGNVVRLWNGITTY